MRSKTERDALLADLAGAARSGPEDPVAQAADRARSSESAEAWNDLGNALMRAGRRDDAERAYGAATEVDAGLYKAWNNLGNVLLERGEGRAAADALARARDLAPDNPRVLLNLGNALVVVGAWVEAAEAYARSAEIAPTWRALHNLATARARLGDAEAALADFRRALELDPAALGTLLDIAEVLAKLGRRDEAAVHLERAAEVVPDDAEVAARVMATAMPHYLDDLAIRVAERALDHTPASEEVLLLYVFALERNDRLEQGEPRFERARRVAVGPGPLLHLARLRSKQRRFTEEVALLEEAERSFPESAHVKAQRARSLRHHDQIEESLELLHRLAAEDPPQDVLDSLANIHLDIGDAHGAAAIYARAEARAATKGAFNRGGYAFLAAKLETVSPEELLRLHRAAAAALAPITAAPPVVSGTLEPERKLRVGYVSADFRSHSVSLFLESILLAHDRSAFDVTCYSITSQDFDATTRRIQSYDLTFRDLRNQADWNIAARVREDRIDVLVDLLGWTGEQQLGTFHLGAAPVQVSYLGYPNTTGLEAIQYRLTDAVADPQGFEAFYTEKLVRLPRCAWAFRPVEAGPEPTPRPAGRPPTFGSFNNLIKVTPATLRLWGRALRAVPGSRVVIKSGQLAHERARARILAALREEGVEADRVELHHRTHRRVDHLALYGSVDVALDTYPYNGTTTTCEALWMGVPVVTLAGRWPASRVSTSLLRAAGLPELATESEDAYVDVASALVTDAARLRELRDGLRARVLASELGDAVGLTRAIEAAYRQMWRDHVACELARRTGPG